MLRLLITSVFTIYIGVFPCLAQNKVAITIDDVPNTRLFQKQNFQTPLLQQLDSLQIPIAIFINEGLIYKTDSISRNFELLVNWIDNEFTTLGNHTFGHSRYSDIGYHSFKNDFEKGAYILTELATKYNKSLHHFRFPYNDLGKDSVQHVKMDSLLIANSYVSTPFTIESSDWMFNYVYEHSLSKGDSLRAKQIGELYVAKTLDYFEFFEALTLKKYNRPVNQIYLCHDNALNAQYLIPIIQALDKKGYEFINLDNAITDSAYHQSFKYHKKWGVSWFYRWMPTQKERIEWMKREPDMSEIETLYQELTSK